MAQVGAPGQEDETFELRWWEVAEICFSLLYLLEMIFKLTILGPLSYCKRGRNQFDGALAVTSVVAEGIAIVVAHGASCVVQAPL
eukprot:SAG22_NODE_223_length_14745_cov_16.175065_3_plen_85_part_00